MAMTKSDVPLTRVNMNIPTELVEKVKKYSNTKGFNLTAGYISLLNQALTTDYLLEKLPELVKLYSVFETSMTSEEKEKLNSLSFMEVLKKGSENN